MAHPSTGAGLAEGLPLTHQNYMTACREQAVRNPCDPQPCVQVRRWCRSGPVTLCGRVTALHVSDPECFVVDTDIGEVYATGRNVRLCSGDGRCTCESLPPGPATRPTAQQTEKGHDVPMGETA
jgi:hypothetical protein